MWCPCETSTCGVGCGCSDNTSACGYCEGSGNGNKGNCKDGMVAYECGLGGCWCNKLAQTQLAKHN